MGAFGVTLKPAGMATGLIFPTTNSKPGKRAGGMCCAMVADWLKSCKRLGRPVKTEGELSNQFTHAITQSSRRNDQYRMRANGLVPPLSTDISPVSFLSLAHSLLRHNGYYWIQVFGDGGGHSVGAFIENGRWEFFDPNFGLYRFDTSLGFVAHITTQMAHEYPDLKRDASVYHFGALY